MGSHSDKVVSLRTLSLLTEKLKREGKKIVLCHGVFDLLHPGHVRHFQAAKKYGDVLVVTITADKFVRKGPGRPIFNEQLRAEVLASLGLVDYVAVVNDYSGETAIKLVKPAIYAKGPDYKRRGTKPSLPRKFTTEEAILKSFGGRIVLTDDEVVFSSSHLINQYIEAYPKRTRKYLEQLRKKYTNDVIFDKLNRLKKTKILVIGDAIIDQYHYTLPMGKSSKEPIVVHIYRREETYAGGTLATANHAVALSDFVQLVTLLGKKHSFTGFIQKHLRPQISPIFFYQDDARTIVKRRYIDNASNQKLFQVSYMKDEVVSPKVETNILLHLKQVLPKFDMVVVNDFGHGMMSPKMIRLICRKAKYLALNVQANSANYGYNIVTKYPRADFVCVDEHELRLATHDKHSELIKLVKKVARKLRCQELVVTRGVDGSISYSEAGGIVEAPALSQLVVDRVGAGDAFFAIAAPCAFIGIDQTLVSFIGNCAGALKVQSVGNKVPIDFKELTKFITRLLK